MTAPDLPATLATIGWSQRELSIRLGCHRNLVGAWIAGRADAPQAVLDWLARLAEAHEALPAPVGWRVQRVG